MSIVADTHALQTRLVQQLASLRQQELDQIVARLSNIGIQSSLIGGFSIQILVNFDSSEHLDVHGSLLTVFYLTSYGCLLASSHSVVVTAFCTSRAPLVALRGRFGALAKALEATRQQQQHVDFSFVWSVILFIAQTFFYAWLNCVAENGNATTLDAILVSALILGAGKYSHRHTMDMLQAFRDADLADPGVQPGAPGSTAYNAVHQSGALATVPEDVGYVAPDFTASALTDSAPAHSTVAGPVATTVAGGEIDETARLPNADEMAHNPMAAVHGDPDLFLRPPIEEVAKPSPCEIHGRLFKRVDDRGLVDKLNWAVEALLSADWRERYFLLSERWLLYWRSHVEFEQYMRGHDVTSPPGLSLLSQACSGPAAAVDEPRQIYRRGSSTHWDWLPGSRATPHDSALTTPLAHAENLPARIELSGYVVNIDMYDSHCGITLQPMPPEPSKRTWQLRAPNKEARRLWTQKLVDATKWAAQQAVEKGAER